MSEYVTLKEIKDWILDGKAVPFPKVLKDKSSISYGYVLTFVKANTKFAFIIMQELYKVKIPEPLNCEKFEYAGVYFYPDGKFYDVDDRIQSCFSPEEEQELKFRGLSSLYEQFLKLAQNEVENVVRNNKNGFWPVNPSDWFQKQIDYLKSHDYTFDICEAFADGKNLDEITDYHSNCIWNINWFKKFLLEYVENPAKFADKEADKYLDKNKEKIALELYRLDKFAEARERFINDAKAIASLTKLKSIVDLARNTDAKKLTVIIRKDGKEYRAKIEVSYLTRTDGNYFEWWLETPEKSEIGNFTYKDIVRITYRGKLLYENTEED